MSLESFMSLAKKTIKFHKTTYFPHFKFPKDYCKSAHLLLEDLWGHIVGGVARGHQHAIVGPQLLGEPKVTDSYGVGVARIVRIENV